MRDQRSTIVLSHTPRSVTVIVPAFNAAGTLAMCIESLLSQTYPRAHTRVVVVDNMSTDSTPQIAHSYPVLVVAENRTQSRGAARNRGIAEADTQLLAFIDADCRADPQWLSHLIDAFADPAVGAVGGRIEAQLDTASLVQRFLAVSKVSDGTQFRPDEPLGLPTGSVAYRREALDKVGLFDTHMTSAEDVDLAWRVQVFGGYRAVFVPDAVVHHCHPTSASALFRQYFRYGLDEIVLSTIYRGMPFHSRTPRHQLRSMLSELRALACYPLSFIIRMARPNRWSSDRLYLFSPLYWFVLQLGHLSGEVAGILKTRFFSKSPYPPDESVVRSKPTVQQVQPEACCPPEKRVSERIT